MKMAADSNMNFHHGIFPSSFYNQHVVSFPSGAINSSAGMALGGMNSSGGIIGTSGMILAGDPCSLSSTSSMIPPGNYSGNNLIFEPMPSLKHDTGLAADWSFEEQAILGDGLIKFAVEPNMMKYIKIAAQLPEKTVRDVALRCRWMAKENVKRRKLEENFAGKKIKDRKEKMVDSSSKTNLHPVPTGNMGAYSFMMHRPNHSYRLPFEVLAVDSGTQHLLEENVQNLRQIADNLSSHKIHDNVDLFFRARNNITDILNSMSQTPGIMSQMPPLPVSVDDNLANTLFSSTNPASVFGTPGRINLKQEPRCWHVTS